MDDNESIQGNEINGYRVLGKTADVGKYPDAYFVCAVGASRNDFVNTLFLNRLNRTS